jgi:cystathionine beta-lyase/cystathionine gamma-synthase
LALGADVVLHSLTKYINGHTDVLMGAAITNSQTLDAHFNFMQRGVQYAALGKLKINNNHALSLNNKIFKLNI